MRNMYAAVAMSNVVKSVFKHVGYVFRNKFQIGNNDRQESDEIDDASESLEEIGKPQFLTHLDLGYRKIVIQYLPWSHQISINFQIQLNCYIKWNSYWGNRLAKLCKVNVSSILADLIPTLTHEMKLLLIIK